MSVKDSANTGASVHESVVARATDKMSVIFFILIPRLLCFFYAAARKLNHRSFAAFSILATSSLCYVFVSGCRFPSVHEICGYPKGVAFSHQQSKFVGGYHDEHESN